MIEYTKSDAFREDKALTKESIAAEFITMGYTPGTAAQLANLNEHMLRDIGMYSGPGGANGQSKFGF